jgi:PhnB protein
VFKTCSRPPLASWTRRLATRISANVGHRTGGNCAAQSHLCFDDEYEIAFREYQRIFGGTIETMLNYGELPMAEDLPAASRSKILHATLAIDGAELTGVDMPPGEYRIPRGFFVTMTIESFTRAKEVFDHLAVNGEVRVPFEPTFWSPGSGSSSTDLRPRGRSRRLL